MIKRNRLFLFFFLLAGMVLSGPQISFAAEKQQTIPTRTPTPVPTNTPGNGGGNPTPVPQPTNEPPPTSTSVPGTLEPTATDVPAVTIAATPEGGFWPTAAPCSPLPTVQALGRVNVRSGPAVDYTLLDQLSYLEVRPITGRAQFATWWQIELADGNRGWVSDAFVQVSGYIGLVPIIPVPSLADGSTPVLEPRWDPTPDPVCTPLPTVTTTPTDTPLPANTPNSASTNSPTTSADSGGRADPSAIPLAAEPAGTATDASAATQETLSPPAAIPVAPTAVENPVLVVDEAPPTEAASGENTGSAGGGLSGWLLPVAGIVLVAVGTALLFFRR